MKRIEVWSDLKCASGTHMANLAPHEIFSVDLSETVDGDSTLVVEFARSSDAWSSVQGRRVLRCIYDDDSVTEHRIARPEERRGEDGGRIARVTADSVLLDLGNGIVSRTEADGRVTLLYTLLSQTRDALVDHILAGAPSYFAKGTVDGPTERVEAFSFNFDNPLKAFQELAQLTGLELGVRRNGDTNYLVDLITQVGSGASVPQFRYRKNILGIRRDPDFSELANRIYAAGGGDGAVRLSLGSARWEVTAAPTSTTLDLAGTPIYADDHLVGDYIETSAGTKIQITDSDVALQRLTVASAHGLSAGALIWLRENSAGKELVYVEDPASQASYGIRAAVIEESDIPPIENLVESPTLRDWTAGVPNDWTLVGSPTIAENTDGLYTQVGGASAHLTCAEGEGIKSAAISIDPTDPDIYFSGFVQVHLLSGEVEFYFNHSTEGRFPVSTGTDADKLADTSELNSFVILQIAGIETFPAGTVELYVVAKDGAAEFYLDAAQFTNSGANYPFFEGRGANKLWARAQAALDERSLPKVTYELNALDLTTIDPTTFPYDALTLGGDVYVYDEDLGFEFTTRVLEIRRDLLAARTLGLTLSNKPSDLSDVLFPIERRERPKDDDEVFDDPLPQLIDFREAERTTTTLKYRWSRSSNTYEVWVKIKVQVQPVPSDPWPTDADPTDAILSIGTDEYAVDFPPSDSITYVQFEPRDINEVRGLVRKVTIQPTGIEVPTIHQDVSQAGDVGSLDLTISDPELRATAIEFQTKTGAGGYGGTWLATWDRSTGTPGTDETLTRGEDITLQEKHTSGIKWRVQFTDADGVTQDIGGGHTFDFDNVAEVTVQSVAIEGSDARVSYAGDEDTVTIWRKDDGAADGTAVQVVAARVGSETIAMGTSVQEYEIAGKNSAGVFGPWVPLKLHKIASSKTLRIHASQLLPITEAMTWRSSPNWLAPNSLTTLNATGAVFLPIGSTITAFRIRGFRTTAGDVVSVELIRVPVSGASLVGISSLSLTGTGSWETAEQTGLSETVASDPYVAYATLTSNSSANDAKLMLAEIDYTVPDFETTL